MKVWPGQDWVKQTSGRLAQVSGMDRQNAYMYWPDKDTQTTVRLERFSREGEWLPSQPSAVSD